MFDHLKELRQILHRLFFFFSRVAAPRSTNKLVLNHMFKVVSDWCIFGSYFHQGAWTRAYLLAGLLLFLFFSILQVLNPVCRMNSHQLIHVYPRRFDMLIVGFFVFSLSALRLLNLIFCCQNGSGTYYPFFFCFVFLLFSYIFVFITCFEGESKDKNI